MSDSQYSLVLGGSALPLHLTYIEDIIDQTNFPQFDICSTQSDTFCMTRLQCMGSMIADSKCGPHSTDPQHLNLCINTIQIAIQSKSDILVTPEYSIPLKLITLIAHDESLQPRQKKIFCLSCEAATLTQFTDLMNELEASGATVEQHALNTDVQENNFVNALVYVFKLKNDQLCFVPQLKTKHSRDRLLECEADGLTLGSTIYVFGKNSPNQFCALICADSLHNEISRNFFCPIGNEHIVVFHPQLNPAPRHHTFSKLRSDFYDYSIGGKIVYITANWAEGTSVVDNSTGKQEYFNIPWSCIYIKNEKTEWYLSLSELIAKNHCHGLGLSYWNDYKVDIWYSYKGESVQTIKIRKPNPAGACALLPAEVVAIATYLHDKTSDSLVQSNSCFEEKLPDCISSLEPEYEYPISVSYYKKDKFFGLCFGHFTQGELLANRQEQCHRLGVIIDSECEIGRKECAEKLLRLVECIRRLSEKPGLPFLQKPFAFGLSDNYKYNLFPTPFCDEKGILATYVDKSSERKQLIQRLNKELRESEYKRTMLFSLDSASLSPQFSCLAESGIFVESRKKNISSITRS